MRFDSQIFEFDPSFNLVYQVVSTKKNAILIISSTDNNTFDTTYNYEDSNEYINKTISAPNLIGINGYLTPNPFTVNLSYWNEFDFYDNPVGLQGVVTSSMTIGAAVKIPIYKRPMNFYNRELKLIRRGNS